MDSLSVLQYDDIKTAIQATTKIGDFSLIWPEPIRNDVAYKLDAHDGFQVDSDSERVSWRDPAYPTREVPSLLDSDRAFVSSFMTILEIIYFNRKERVSNDSYYSHVAVRPSLPSAAIQLLNTCYVERIAREDSNVEGLSSYFVSWKKEFSIQDKFSLYKLLCKQYKEMFIHLS